MKLDELNDIIAREAKIYDFYLLNITCICCWVECAPCFFVCGGASVSVCSVLFYAILTANDSQITVGSPLGIRFNARSLSLSTSHFNVSLCLCVVCM